MSAVHPKGAVPFVMDEKDVSHDKTSSRSMMWSDEKEITRTAMCHSLQKHEVEESDVVRCCP